MINKKVIDKSVEHDEYMNDIYSSIINKDNKKLRPNVINEYDKDGVHCMEFDDGTVRTSTYRKQTEPQDHTAVISKLPTIDEHIASMKSSALDVNDTSFAKWKTKKDYIKHMNPLIRILYYLWIIVLYKKLPVEQQGHLVNDKGFLQTIKGSTYATYWHWNWWNPLTYVIVIGFTLFMFVMNIFLSIIETLQITSIIKVEINNE